MNRFYQLLIAGALVCAPSVAFSQSIINGIIVAQEINGGRPTEVVLSGGNQQTLLYKLGAQEIDPRQLPFASIKGYYMLTPTEYVSAMESFQNAKYREAKAKFEDIKNKCKAVEDLPLNYSAMAAFMEVECAVKLLDWGAVKSLAAQLPKHAHVVTPLMMDKSDVYTLLGKLADNNNDDIISTAKGMLASKKARDLEQTGRINFALGSAQAAKGDKKNALDSLAMSIALQRGAEVDLAASAVVKSMDILAADPVVTEYVKNAAPDLEPKAKLSAPLALQELSALAYMYVNVLNPHQKLDAKYEKYLNFYVNSIERERLRNEKSQADGQQEEAKPAEAAPAEGDNKQEQPAAEEKKA